MRIIKPESTILKSQRDNIEIDWDELDKFWADRYEADYGNYILHQSEEES